MNNLLFTALIITLIYYFFYYLPQQKKLVSNPILTHSQFTQTNPILTENNQEELDNLKQQLKTKDEKQQELEKNYHTKLSETQTQVTKLQSEIRELVKRPLKPTHSKSTQTDNQDLENTLDTLIKDIQALNNEL